MADDKKAPKKFDKKEAPPKKGGHDVLLEIVGVVFGLVILLSAFSGSSIYNSFSNTNSSPNAPKQVAEGDFSFWQKIVNSSSVDSFPGPGSLAVGKDTINERLTQIRREPGGSVIGIQQRGEKAMLVDGPIDAFGAKWWMANYSSAPSGWVDERDITTEFFWYYVVNFIPITWDYFKILSWALSGFFALVIIYVIIREQSVPMYDETEEDIKTKAIVPATSLTPQTIPANLPVGSVAEREENERWKHVELLMQSHNPSDWRQAVIEVDVMLEDMLDKMGYPGVSIGDKLKNIEKGDFQTLDKAWEAHKVRNRIAHDGSMYKFSYDEAARVVSLYKDVFNEFYWI